MRLPLSLLASVILCSAAWAQTTLQKNPTQKPVIAADTASTPQKTAPKTDPNPEPDLSEPHLKAAVIKAKANVNELLKVLASTDPKYDQNKVGALIRIQEGNVSEMVWMMPFEKEGDGYIGFVNSAPNKLKRTQFSNHREFKREDIIDWMYVDKSTNTMHGQYIICAQMRHDAPQDAAALQKRHGLHCK